MADLQNFGGQWTQKKLAKVSSYLTAYTNALKNMPFTLIYIDAFAGTGYRTMEKSSDLGFGIFIDQVGDDLNAFHDGSAKIALQTNPRFNSMVKSRHHKRVFILSGRVHLTRGR